MYHLLFLIVSIFLFLAVPSGVSAIREIDNQKYPQVGLLKYRGDIFCASFIIKHGVIVTAKHCFTHGDVDERNFSPEMLEILLVKKENIDQNPLRISGENIFKLLLDRGENDIAFILYNRKLTEGIINLSSYKINSNNAIIKDSQVFRAGFPMGHNHVFDKVVTSACRYTGKKGYFESTILDIGYEGILFDTDCPAWFGDSGGPVFSLKKEKNGSETILVHGVLSHTFDVDFAGNLLEEARESDHIGEYIRSSMFSPFHQAKDLDIAYDEEKKFYQKLLAKKEISLKEYRKVGTRSKE